MTKRWSSTRSGGDTKRAALKRVRRIGNLPVRVTYAEGFGPILKAGYDVDEPTITYPPEMLPSPEEGDAAEVIVVEPKGQTN